ncbi:MAG: hypothetical protein EKK57_00330, partial [Proteobacteria bacterium]
MASFFEKIFPRNANNDYKGNKLAAYVFLLLAVIGTVRSCIHFLAHDGGAGTIAGMNLSVAGADGIIFAFSLWGSSQLLYAIIQLVVFFRYRTLIPFMYILMLCETAMRMFIGHIKPVHFAHTPPGEILNHIMIPITIIMFLLSL